MKRVNVYALDLTKIKGEGDFPCPLCGNAMSPDDKSEETYSIIEPKVDSFGLKELVIRCNRCESIIHLTGFILLQKLSDLKEEAIENKKEESLCYVAHL